MNILLTQLILAGRGEDTEGWMSILVVVVLAVFWAISGIVKATAKKPQDGQPQQPSRKPVRGVSPPTTARDASSARPPGPAQARPQPRSGTATAGEPRRRLGQLAAELEKAFHSYPTETTPKPALPRPTPRTEPALQEPPDVSSRPLKELEHERRAAPKGRPQEEDLLELEFDFADPDELSRAILHYEILGRPLSLRDPSGQTVGF